MNWHKNDYTRHMGSWHGNMRLGYAVGMKDGCHRTQRVNVTCHKLGAGRKYSVIIFLVCSCTNLCKTLYITAKVKYVNTFVCMTYLHKSCVPNIWLCLPEMHMQTTNILCTPPKDQALRRQLTKNSEKTSVISQFRPWFIMKSMIYVQAQIWSGPMSTNIF
jgi:hypothetical protein